MSASQQKAGPTLPTVHMFWHGALLSRIERLCMASYVANGHELCLHVYDEPQGVPRGVSLCDARALIPARRMYRHEKTGSLALFADYFRFRILHAVGGIWSDTDVVCLRPLAYTHAEIFAWQEPGLLNVAVLGLPAGHPLADWMASCCEEPNRVLPYDDLRFRARKWRRRWFGGNRRGNVIWGEVGPDGFSRAAKHFDYTRKALSPSEFYPVHWRDWKRVFSEGNFDWDDALRESKALHLWNELLRRNQVDKNAYFAPSSLYEQLCRRYLGDSEASERDTFTDIGSRYPRPHPMRREVRTS
jgi:hypothetical protein